MAESATPEVRRRSSRRSGSRAARRGELFPFPELAHLHHRWRQALEEDPNPPDLAQRATAYHAARAAFEEEHGPIVSEYWCWNVPSAVALTEKPRRKVDSWFRKPFPAFHRASDWATKDHPDVAKQMHRCDELAIKASALLSGVRRVICLRLVMSSAAHLLSFVDERDGPRKPAENVVANAENVVADTENVVADEKRALDKAQAYLRTAANGQAQIVYFLSMALAAVAIGALALLGSSWMSVPGVDKDDLWASVAAGAFGAVVSVVQRINSGQFALTYDVGRPYVVFLGALRPVLGAAFGLVLYLAVVSGLLDVFEVPTDDQTKELFFFIVIAFLAGFNERWAQDTLTSLGQGSGRTDPAAQTPPPGGGGGGGSPPSTPEATE